MNYPIITASTEEESQRIIAIHTAVGINASMVDMDEVKAMLEQGHTIYFFCWDNILYYTYKELPDSINYELLIPFADLKQRICFKSANLPIFIIGE
ncbi:MAG: hypothetical protein PHX08_06675 [Lachnospiraceae bacterium]|nr:hypothetical protein [Lachnospiraceae bacterium]